MSILHGGVMGLQLARFFYGFGCVGSKEVCSLWLVLDLECVGFGLWLAVGGGLQVVENGVLR